MAPCGVPCVQVSTRLQKKNPKKAKDHFDSNNAEIFVKPCRVHEAVVDS